MCGTFSRATSDSARAGTPEYADSQRLSFGSRWLAMFGLLWGVGLQSQTLSWGGGAEASGAEAVRVFEKKPSPWQDAWELDSSKLAEERCRMCVEFVQRAAAGLKPKASLGGDFA